MNVFLVSYQISLKTGVTAFHAMAIDESLNMPPEEINKCLSSIPTPVGAKLEVNRITKETSAIKKTLVQEKIPFIHSRKELSEFTAKIKKTIESDLNPNS